MIRTQEENGKKNLSQLREQEKSANQNLSQIREQQEGTMNTLSQLKNILSQLDVLKKDEDELFHKIVEEESFQIFVKEVNIEPYRCYPIFVKPSYKISRVKFVICNKSGIPADR